MEFFGRHLHDHLPSALHESLFLSYEQVYLRSAKNTTFLPPFPGASAKYLGERNGALAKKSGDEWQKERFTMHASLWILRKFADSSN
jgi:hypothetical protein